jgi:hypothetical protein
MKGKLTIADGRIDIDVEGTSQDGYTPLEKIEKYRYDETKISF